MPPKREAPVASPAEALRNELKSSQQDKNVAALQQFQPEALPASEVRALLEAPPAHVAAPAVAGCKGDPAPPSPHPPRHLQADLVAYGIHDLLLVLAARGDCHRAVNAGACKLLARFAGLPGPLQTALATPAAARTLHSVLDKYSAAACALDRGAAGEEAPAAAAKPKPPAAAAAASKSHGLLDVSDEDAAKQICEAALRGLASLAAASPDVLALVQQLELRPVVALLGHPSQRLQVSGRAGAHSKLDACRGQPRC
jgi:hypothetical protein